jgi:hypothetical protein
MLFRLLTRLRQPDSKPVFANGKAAIVSQGVTRKRHFKRAEPAAAATTPVRPHLHHHLGLQQARLERDAPPPQRRDARADGALARGGEGRGAVGAVDQELRLHYGDQARGLWVRGVVKGQVCERTGGFARAGGHGLLMRRLIGAEASCVGAARRRTAVGDWLGRGDRVWEGQRTPQRGCARPRADHRPPSSGGTKAAPPSQSAPPAAAPPPPPRGADLADGRVLRQLLRVDFDCQVGGAAALRDAQRGAPLGEAGALRDVLPAGRGAARVGAGTGRAWRAVVRTHVHAECHVAASPGGTGPAAGARASHGGGRTLCSTDPDIKCLAKKGQSAVKRAAARTCTPPQGS